MQCPVVPACIPKSRAEVLSFLQTVQFAHEIQIDVVDGVFVPNVSWPYEPAGEPKTIKHATDAFTLEIDLMVAAPIKAAAAWIEAGADMLVFHVESIDLATFRAFAATCPVSIGVASHGDTPLESFFAYVEVADYIQLMGIRQIGIQAEPFDERVLETITAVKSRYSEKMISIDGSVNETTIERLHAAGADRFVSGSAILSSTEPQTAYTDLCERVN